MPATQVIAEPRGSIRPDQILLVNGRGCCEGLASWPTGICVKSWQKWLSYWTLSEYEICIQMGSAGLRR